MVNLSYDGLASGQIIDGFEIQCPLGVGGIGAVYKATQLAVGRTVALKVLHPGLAEVCQWRDRFLQEGRICAGLEHQGIVKCFAFGLWHDRIPYLVFELVDGQTLRERLKKREKLSWQESLRICLSLAEALEYAHICGIVHRDLKPENIMMLGETGTCSKILDFGLARVCFDDKFEKQKLTQTGAALGSWNYMSPEQAGGGAVDHRADIYALGCILYECLEGMPPSAAGTHAAAVSRRARSALVRKESNEFLNCVLFKALEAKPEDRYQTMRELRQALENLLSGVEPESLTNDDLARYKELLRSSRNIPRLAPTAQILIVCSAILVVLLVGYKPIAIALASALEGLGGEPSATSFERLGDHLASAKLWPSALTNYQISSELWSKRGNALAQGRVFSKLADTAAAGGNHLAACSYATQAIKALVPAGESDKNSATLRSLLLHSWDMLLEHYQRPKRADLDLLDKTAQLPIIRDHAHSALQLNVLRIRLAGTLDMDSEVYTAAMQLASDLSKKGNLSEALRVAMLGLKSLSLQEQPERKAQLLNFILRTSTELGKKDVAYRNLPFLESILFDPTALPSKQRNRLILAAAPQIAKLDPVRLEQFIQKARLFQLNYASRDEDLGLVLLELKALGREFAGDTASAFLLSKKLWTDLPTAGDHELRRLIVQSAGPRLLHAFATQTPKMNPRLPLTPSEIESIRKNSDAPTVPIVADFALSRCYRERGNIERGVQLIEQALDNCRSRFGPTAAADVASGYGNLLIVEGHAQPAKTYIEKQIALAKKGGVRGKELAMLYVVMANSLSNQGTEARNFLRLARAANKASGDLATERDIEAVERDLSRIYPDAAK